MKKRTKKEEKNSTEDLQEQQDLLDHRVKKSIFAVLIIMVALIFVLSLFNLAGVVGEYVNKGLSFLFGWWGKYLLPLVMVVLGILYFRKMKPIRYTLAAVGAVLFYLMFLGAIHILRDSSVMVEAAKQGAGGGYVGLGIAYPLAHYLGKIAGFIILIGFSLIGIILLFNAPLYKLVETFKERLLLKRKSKENKEDKEENKDKDENNDPKESEDQKDDEKDNNIQEEENDGLSKEDQSSESKDSFDTNIKKYSFDESNEDKFFEESKKKKKRRLRKKENIHDGMNWKLPPYDLIESNKERPHQENKDEIVELIVKKFKEFGITVSPREFHVGPTVTQYTFKPADSVRVNKITAFQEDLALALAAHSVRIEAPIPGKALIGIEVPNKKPSWVRLRTMLESDAFKNRPSDLSVIFGEDVNGYPVLADIGKMPHMLVAGSTGTGKSICINTIITTLLYQNSPEDLRLILVDPKRVELSLYNGIPHLLTPVIVDYQKVVGALRWSVSEMEKRLRIFQEVGSRDIESYNDKVGRGEKRKVIDKKTGDERQEMLEKIPYIVIVIDELADLMAAHAKDIEGSIVRLAQMARAAGIHLIVSTQRPSVEVITGLIKANIATRIAFQVTSLVDSRTILDRAGAEKLLGNGDLLFSNAEIAKPRRVQGVFISEKEVKRVTDFIKDQDRNIEHDDNSEDLSEILEQQFESVTGIFSGMGTEGVGDDELYEDAKEIVIQAKKASTSMLQRRLKIGYSRAARIIDMLEENGVVGSAEGSKAREILVDSGNKKQNDGVAYENEEIDQKKRDDWQ